MACGILSKRTSQILPFAGSQVPGLVSSAFSQNQLNQAQDDALPKSEFGPAIARKRQDRNNEKCSWLSLTVRDAPISNEEGSHEMVMEDW